MLFRSGLYSGLDHAHIEGDVERLDDGVWDSVSITVTDDATLR